MEVKKKEVAALEAKRQFEMLVSRCIEVMAERIRDEVPVDCDFSRLSVSFVIPSSENRALLIAEKSLIHEKKMFLLAGVMKKDSDKLFSISMFEGEKQEVLCYISKDTLHGELQEQISELSDRADDDE